METQHIVIRRVLTALMCFASALFASLSPMEDASADGFAYFRGTDWVISSNFATPAAAIAAAVERCNSLGLPDCDDTTTDTQAFSNEVISAIRALDSTVSPVVFRVFFGTGGNLEAAIADATTKCLPFFSAGQCGSLVRSRICGDGTAKGSLSPSGVDSCDVLPGAIPLGTSTSSSGDARKLALWSLGGATALFVASGALGGTLPDFIFLPNIGVAATENGYSYNAGGQLNFHKDNWHFYWTAAQENANGDFGALRYGSGGSYTTDLWSAKFSENAEGKTMAYNFALSADVESGIWKLSPVYRMQARFEEDGKSETDNALNLEGILRYNRWTISPSAGFRWENAEDFGDEARFGLSMVRQL